MTVEKLIEALQKIDDKTLDVFFVDYFEDGCDEAFRRRCVNTVELQGYTNKNGDVLPGVRLCDW